MVASGGLEVTYRGILGCVSMEFGYDDSLKSKSMISSPNSA